MRELTIYVAKDGSRFTNKSDCELWEQILPTIQLTRQTSEDGGETSGDEKGVVVEGPVRNGY